MIIIDISVHRQSECIDVTHKVATNLCNTASTSKCALNLKVFNLHSAVRLDYYKKKYGSVILKQRTRRVKLN